MRYLLHNSNATYSTTTKTWSFDLDRRISNPTRLALNKCNFSPVTTLTPLPHVIYMHSRALSDMISQKHTVILKGDSHENSSDVIAILEETHTRGRYGLKEKDISFPVNPHTVKRSIDIYFTDGTGTKLDGTVEEDPEAGGGGGGGAADDSTISDMGSGVLKMWADFSHSDNIMSAAYEEAVEDGDEVAIVVNRQPGSQTLIFTTSAGKFELTSFGETKAATGVASWVSMQDSAGGIDITDGEQFFCMMMKFPPTAETTALFDNDTFQFAYMSNLTLNYWKNNGWSGVFQSTTFLPTQDWYLQFHQHDQDLNGSFQWDCLFRRLSNNEEYTETVYPDGNVDTSAFAWWRISAANTHFNAAQSHMILLHNPSEAQQAAAKTWMLAKYSTAAAEEGGEDVATPAEDASFFAELNLKVK